MSSLDEVKAQLAVLTEAVNSLEVAPTTVPETPTEVDVVEPDGTTEKFAPEA